MESSNTVQVKFLILIISFIGLIQSPLVKTMGFLNMRGHAETGAPDHVHHDDIDENLNFRVAHAHRHQHSSDEPEHEHSHNHVTSNFSDQPVCFQASLVVSKLVTGELKAFICPTDMNGIQVVADIFRPPIS